MGRLLISTAMTVDGVIEVTDWYVPAASTVPPRSPCTTASTPC